MKRSVCLYTSLGGGVDRGRDLKVFELHTRYIFQEGMVLRRLMGSIRRFNIFTESWELNYL